MKRLLVLSITFIQLYGHTIYLTPKPIAYDQTYQLALNNYTMFNAHTHENTAFNFFASPLYQSSFDPEYLGSLFNPSCCRNTIDIEESGSGDVGSLWLQLISQPGTMFSSEITLRPKEETYGSLFLMQTNFNSDCGWWMSAATAVIKRQRNLRLLESNQHENGTLPGLKNATQALANPNWNYGKLAWKELCTSGIDDVEVRLGYNYVRNDNQWYGIYALGGIPTGNHMNAAYLFEPTVGSLHGSLGCGLKASCTHELSCATLTFMTDFKYRYQFQAREFRMYDLCPNGPWSRYLLLVNDENPLDPLPAINDLATLMNVKPGNTIDWWSAINFDFCCWNIETGCSLWYQQKETICASRCTSGPQIAVGVYDLPNVCTINSETCSLARIQDGVNSNITSDAGFTQLRPENLQIQSAASPKQVSLKSYIAGNYQIQSENHPSSIGIVAAYDSFSSRNGIDTWSLWFTLGLSF